MKLYKNQIIGMLMYAVCHIHYVNHYHFIAPFRYRHVDYLWDSVAY